MYSEKKSHETDPSTSSATDGATASEVSKYGVVQKTYINNFISLLLTRRFLQNLQFPLGALSVVKLLTALLFS